MAYLACLDDCPLSFRSKLFEHAVKHSKRGKSAFTLVLRPLSTSSSSSPFAQCTDTILLANYRFSTYILCLPVNKRVYNSDCILKILLVQLSSSRLHTPEYIEE